MFLRRNVPSDDEAFYTIVGGQGFEFSFGAPPLFDDPQFLTAWTVEQPTTSATSSRIADVGEVRSLAVPLFAPDGTASGVFVVANFPAADQTVVNNIVRSVTLGGLVVLALSAVVAWSLAGRVLRPVRRLTATARRISDSDLSARIPVEGRDELAELGRTFNEMLDRLDHGFRSQRHFLDDVAHELRTPITIARGHLEVLGGDPDEVAEVVEVVTDELDRMSRYVSDLLILAKAEQPDFLIVEPIDLGELAIDLHQRIQPLGKRRWVLDVAPPSGRVTAIADRERLTQAVVNLAANAVQHTADDQEIGIGVDATDDARPPVGARHRPRHRSRHRHHPVRPILARRQQPHRSPRRHRTRDCPSSTPSPEPTAEPPASPARPDEGATFVITIPLGTTSWAPPSPPSTDPRPSATPRSTR